MSQISVVVGGQYGSEAKGHVTAKLVKFFRDNHAQALVVAARVAGPNAGHTAYDPAGNKFAFRQIPVGAVMDDEVVAMITAGSEIDPPVLFKELDELRDKGHTNTVYVDLHATLIEDHHKEAEAGAALVANIGSTGKGIGAARADRLMRKAKRVIDDPQLIKELRSIKDVYIADTASLLHTQLARRDFHLVVEGTQGYGLGLHGEHYPQCTSSDARAIDFLAMAGVSPWHPGVTGVLVEVVARVYPIRVAGNSGPLHRETTWEELGLPEERTTVTQKVRRVGHWDKDLIRRAVRANGGGVNMPQRKEDAILAALGIQPSGPRVMVALTMLDQAIPELAGKTDWASLDLATREKVSNWVRKVQNDSGTRVNMIATGPTTTLDKWEF